MSPRAACRLEHLGFADVYDYVPGKSDWMAAGLPREGQSRAAPYAGDLAARGVPTCSFRATVDTAAAALREHGFCVAVDDQVVLGMVYERDVENADPSTTVEQVMRPGPTTVRANEPVAPLVERMHAADVDAILVTDPEGRMLGLLNRHDAGQHDSAQRTG